MGEGKYTTSERSNSGQGGAESAVVRAWRRLNALNAAYRYLLLLVSLESLTWNAAFWTDQAQTVSGLTWNDCLGVLTLLAGIFAICRRRLVLGLALILALAPLILAGAAHTLQSMSLLVASGFASTMFLAFTGCLILYDIWHTQGVRADTVIGSLCTFMLLAAAWAYLYLTIELLLPGSFFYTASGPALHGQEQLARCDYPIFMYYSFVTLCTLGYGDIIPVRNAARALASWEVVVGQFYMAVFVARLVGLYTAHATREPSRP